MKVKLERLFSCTVTLADNYSDGSHKICQQSFNIIICELTENKGISSLNFLKRQDNQLNATEIILTTIEEDPEILKQADSLGCHCTVVKTNKFFTKLVKILSELGVSPAS